MSSQSVALLTGGSDKPYAIGLASALAAQGVAIDFIGSDELNCPQVHEIPNLTFLNLRGDQREDASLLQKVRRIGVYYGRLIQYAATAKPSILHILWNNKFEVFDRTLLMAYYRSVGNRIVLTAHNVNMAARDRRDSWVNRVSLRIQYRLCDHIFVHTDAMKRQLVADFAVAENRVSVIPFGINDTIPRSKLTPSRARQELGIADGERALLFFGQIASYKGLEHLISAAAILANSDERVRVIVAGKVKRGSEDYWRNIRTSIDELGIGGLVLERARFIPDSEVEQYFKAADAVVLPYVDIFQSGVPFLAFSFGLPVIATDVGSLHEDVTSETGILCRPGDPGDLARAIAEFYRSDLHLNRKRARARIRSIASENHSWQKVGVETCTIYRTLVDDGESAIAARSSVSPQRPVPTKCPE